VALTNLQIQNACATDRVTQYTDDRGLYLEVHPSGSKLWRYKYRYLGKQNRLAIGRYPDVSLAEARKRRDDARRQLDDGIDPLAKRKRDKLVAVFNAANIRTASCLNSSLCLIISSVSLCECLTLK
jgi:hypothetical protein